MGELRHAAATVYLINLDACLARLLASANAELAFQRVEQLLPYTGMTPAAKTPVNRLPRAVAFRQMPPMRARKQNPQTSVHERRIIRSAPEHGYLGITHKPFWEP